MDLAIILLLLLVVVLLWRGPRTLPKLGESLGDAIRSVRRATNERTDDEPATEREPREDRPGA
jgi:TatA/E family protein of Tat protein translocase